MLPFFCSGTTKPSVSQAQTKLSTSIKVSIPSTSVSKFSMMLRVVFKPLPGHQCKASVTLLLIALPQEESHNSVLIYIF